MSRRLPEMRRGAKAVCIDGTLPSHRPKSGKPFAVNLRNLVTIVSLMVLVGTEVFAAAVAAGWALAGLFELGDTVGHVLMGVFSLGAAWVMLQLWRRAISIEPISGRRRAA